MTKKVISLLLTIVMVLALGIPSFATESTGTLTIANSSKDRTYTLYKVFDATVGKQDAVAYKLLSGKTLPENPYFSATNAGDVTIIEETAEGSDGFLTEEAVEWLKTNTSFFEVKESIKGNGKDLTFNNLTYGYYFVDTGNGAAVTINSVVDDAVVYDKNNDRPGPAPKSPTDPEDNDRPYKSITVDGQKDVQKTTTDAGEVLNFTVTFEATNYYQSSTDFYAIKEYKITDYPSEGLDVDLTKATVKVDGVEKTAHITKSATSITLMWAELSGTDVKSFYYKSPAIVEINYTAKMPLGTATNSVKIDCITTDGETINIKDKNDDEPDVELANYTVSVITSPTDLDGEYVLKNKYDKYYKFNSGTNTVSWVDSKEEATKGTEFEGVKNGEYSVEETTAPKGYNNVDTPAEVTVSNADASVIFNYKKGIRLPSTGGAGTKVFYVLGGVLVAAAAVLLVYKKKMSAQQ